MWSAVDGAGWGFRHHGEKTSSVQASRIPPRAPPSSTPSGRRRGVLALTPLACLCGVFFLRGSLCG